jgi:hypothetical protein
MRAKKEEPVNSLADAIGEIQRLTNKTTLESEKKVRNEIVDIITFCNDLRYLNLPGNNFHLFLAQRVILKTFYMGSRGNENLKLTQEEWEWLYKLSEPMELDGVIYENNMKEVIRKILDKEKGGCKDKHFRELHLVLGRRGTKTITSSIITAYEVYKLLVIGNGDPHKFYGLPFDDEIGIINVALSQDQAGRLFGQIESRIRNCPFFVNRIASASTKEIRFYTDRDLEKKKKGSQIEVRGSVFVLCGHSNPDTLRGHNVILLLFDELALYDDSGQVTGSYFYDTLKKSLAKFVPFGDDRIVAISSPSTMNGIFYDIFLRSKKHDNILSYQLPTWITNPEITYENLRDEKEQNPDSFIVEYGAQWAKSGNYGSYFQEPLIQRCVQAGISRGLSPQYSPQPGVNYYLHVDPAISRDRYVAVLVAKEIYVNHYGKRRSRVLLANIWIWDPQPGIGLLYNQIDRDVINICSTFHPLAVSYDQFNSVASLQLLRSHGINCISTSFNRAYKNKIYQNLREMMAYQPEPEILLYEDARLVAELKNLKFRPTLRGVTFLTDKHAEVNTDDLVDCLSGASAMASENVRMALPASVLVRTGWV